MAVFAERFSAALKRADITAAELSRILHIPEGTLSQYKAGVYEPKRRRVEALARALDVSADWLTGASDEYGSGAIAPEPGVPAALRALAAALNDPGVDELVDYGRYLLEKPEYRLAPDERRTFYTARTPDTAAARVRYIRDYLTPAAAGYASPVEGEDYADVPVDADTPAAADFSIHISGDSMEPYIRDGERVFVQRDVALRDFDVGIFYVSGNVFCKQYCQDPLGNVYLLSANPKREDANVLIRHDSAETLVCFGRVLLPRRLPRPVYG